MPTQSGYGYVEGYSDIQKFTDIPIPTPKGNEVLLKVKLPDYVFLIPMY